MLTQANRPPKKLTNRQKFKQTDTRQTDIPIEELAITNVDEQINRQTDKYTKREQNTRRIKQVNRQTNEQKNRKTNRQKVKQIIRTEIKTFAYNSRFSRSLRLKTF